MMTLNIRKPSKFEFNTCEVIEVNKYEIWNSHLYRKDTMNENDYIQLFSEFEYKISVNVKPTSTSVMRKHIKEPIYILYPREKQLLKFFNKTTQLGRMNIAIPMRRHVKSSNPILQRHRINKPYAMGNWFYTTTSYEGYNRAQIFYGTRSKVI